VHVAIEKPRGKGEKEEREGHVSNLLKSSPGDIEKQQLKGNHESQKKKKEAPPALA